MRYRINIEETVVGEFTVEANSKSEAIEIAKAKYRNCEFVNCPGDLVEKRISVCSKDNECLEWEVF